MHYVYIIKSEIYPKRVYTGYTKDLKNRLKEHNKGKSLHTNRFKPWKLVFYCGFEAKKKAIEFELYLKSSSGIAFRNKRLV